MKRQKFVEVLTKNFRKFSTCFGCIFRVLSNGAHQNSVSVTVLA